MIVALDFGTCFSSVAIAQDGEVKRVRAPATSGYSFPSSVLVSADGSRLFGQAAEDRRLADPEGYVAHIKRRLGSRGPIVVRGSLRCGAGELIQSLLGYLREQAELAAGEAAADAVLTVPASYLEGRTSLMRELALGAGFRHVELVPEPVAAAMHYMAQASSGRRLDPGEVVLVYDLGGGTFDATLVRRTHTGGELVGLPAGLEHRGGLDIDEAVRKRVADDFCAREPERIAPLLDRERDDPAALRLQAGLIAACVRTKHVLSEADEDEVVLSLGADIATHRLSRAELEALVTPHIEETIATCGRLIEQWGLEQPPGGVLLVGGVTRMPLVGRLVQERLQLPLLRVDEPELAVCLGASRASRARSELAVEGPLAALAVARDSTEAASGDVAGCVHVWSVEQGAAIATPRDRLPSVSAVALSHDGELLAIGGADGAVRVWPWGEAVAPRVIGWHGGWVNGLAFSADRAFMLSGGDDGFLRATPLRTDGSVRELPAHGGGILALATVPGGGPIVTGGADGDVRLWNLAAASPRVGELKTGASVRALAVTRDGRRLAAGTADGRILVWQLESGELLHELQSHEGATRALAFEPDRRLASGGADGFVRRWDLAAGVCESAAAHDGGVRALAVRRDGLLLSAGADARIRLWWPRQQGGGA